MKLEENQAYNKGWNDCIDYIVEALEIYQKTAPSKISGAFDVAMQTIRTEKR